MKGLELPGWARGAAAFHGVALWLWAVAPLALAGAPPAFAIELSPPQAGAVYDGFDLPAVGRLNDGLLRVRLPAPRNPQLHAR